MVLLKLVAAFFICIFKKRKKNIKDEHRANLKRLCVKSEAANDEENLTVPRQLMPKEGKIYAHTTNETATNMAVEETTTTS